MKVDFTFTGLLRIKLKKSKACLDIENGSTVTDALNILLASMDPMFVQSIKKPSGEFDILTLINGERASTQTILNDGDNVAFVSQIAGG